MKKQITISQALAIINEGRSDDWIEYDKLDWEDGWENWVTDEQKNELEVLPEDNYREISLKYKSKFINAQFEFVGAIVVACQGFSVLNADKKDNKRLSNCLDFQEDVLDAINAEEVIIEN